MHQNTVSTNINTRVNDRRNEEETESNGGGASNLPAYSLQPRCGALWALIIIRSPFIPLSNFTESNRCMPHFIWLLLLQWKAIRDQTTSKRLGRTMLYWEVGTDEGGQKEMILKFRPLVQEFYNSTIAGHISCYFWASVLKIHLSEYLRTRETPRLPGQYMRLTTTKSTSRPDGAPVRIALPAWGPSLCELPVRGTMRPWRPQIEAFSRLQAEAIAFCS